LALAPQVEPVIFISNLFLLHCIEEEEEEAFAQTAKVCCELIALVVL